MAALERYRMRRIKVRDIVSVTDKTFKEKIKAIENKTKEENNYTGF